MAEEIAKRLGVEVEWITPSWDVITAGNWNGRWDLSVGSMTPTPERQKVLHFSSAARKTPAPAASWRLCSKATSRTPRSPETVAKTPPVVFLSRPLSQARKLCGFL